MSVTELMPIINALTYAEKLQLMQKLFQAIIDREDIEPEVNKKQQMRPIGLQKNHFSVPQSFFEPLTEELLDAFEGRE